MAPDALALLEDGCAGSRVARLRYKLCWRAE
jgi:hypothetical protein